MGNWVNWLLIIGGIVCAIVELALGAITGFDLALIGASAAVGGAIGLQFASYKIGLLAASALALLYVALLRRILRAKLKVKEQPTNVDALIGKSGVVSKRIAPREAGLVKIGPEEWRAELIPTEDSAREVGAVVTVNEVEGVTVRVK